MLKFQAVAEKTAKNFRGLLFCRTLYMTVMCISRVTFLIHVLVNILANSVSYLLITDYKIINYLSLTLTLVFVYFFRICRA